MLKTITKLGISLLSFISIISHAQTPNWWDLIEAQVSNGANGYYQNIAFNSHGVAYIAFQSASSQNKTIVKKYNGVTWAAVGGANGFGATNVIEQKLVINKASNNPIVSYVDENIGASSVMSFNGVSWSFLGGANAINGYGTVLALNSNNVPYVAFNNTLNNIVVQSFSGSNWIQVGTISGTIPALSRFTLVFSPSGVPFVSYTDNATTKVNVVSFSGSSWNIVGNANLSAGDNAYQSMAFNSAGTPFIAYQDASVGNRATVMSLGGSNWNVVGKAGFSATVSGLPSRNFVSYLSLAFNNADVPHLAFSRGETNMVVKFNGTNWVDVAAAPASNNGAGTSPGDRYQSMAFNPITNEPWVALNAEQGYYGTVIRYGINCLELANAQPTIIFQPTSKTSCQLFNETNTFSVTGAGFGLFYEWSNGVQGRVMTTSVLGNNYRVTVSGTCGKVTSDVFTHTAKSPTTIATQPESVTVCGGTLAYFTVSAGSSNIPINYTWNTGLLGTNQLATTVPGIYNVTLSSACGSVVSNDVTLTNTYTILEAPILSQTVCKGTEATFAVSVTGEDLTYTWSNNSTDAQIVTTTAGMYTVTVNSKCGSLYPDPVILSLKETLINTQPVSRASCEGVPTSFSVSASGNNLNYLWNNGTMDRTLITTIVGNYTVTVTGECGSKISETANLSLRVCTFAGTKIIFPNSNAVTLTGTNTLLTWATLPGANTYCIRLSKTNTFTDNTTKTICGLAAAQYLVNITSPGARTETIIEENWFYQVAGVDANNDQSLWSDTQSFTTFRVDNTTNDNDELLVLNNELIIVPNPYSNGELKIKNAEMGAIMYIFNAQGSIVYSQKVVSETTLVNANFIKGIYLIKVGSETKKLVVE